MIAERCEVCGRLFDWEELIRLYIDDDGREHWTHPACPKEAGG